MNATNSYSIDKKTVTRNFGRTIRRIQSTVKRNERQTLNPSVISKRIPQVVIDLYDVFGAVTNHSVNPRSKQLSEINESTAKFLDRHYQSSKDPYKIKRSEYPYYTDRQIDSIARKEYAVNQLGEFHIGTDGNSRKSTTEFDSNDDERGGVITTKRERTPIVTKPMDHYGKVYECTTLLERCNKIWAMSLAGCYDSTETLSDLRKAIRMAKLSDKERQVIDYRYNREFTQAEISEELSVSQPVVSKRLNSAIAKIQTIYDYWDSLEDENAVKLDGLTESERYVYVQVIELGRSQSAVATDLGASKSKISRMVAAVRSKIA